MEVPHCICSCIWAWKVLNECHDWYLQLISSRVGKFFFSNIKTLRKAHHQRSDPNSRGKLFGPPCCFALCTAGATQYLRPTYLPIEKN
jgi:hypothetical protein